MSPGLEDYFPLGVSDSQDLILFAREINTSEVVRIIINRRVELMPQQLNYWSINLNRPFIEHFPINLRLVRGFSTQPCLMKLEGICI